MLDGETLAQWFKDHKNVELSDIELESLDEFVARERRRGVHIPIKTVQLDMQVFSEDGTPSVRSLEIYPLTWGMLKEAFATVEKLDAEGSDLADDEAVKEFTDLVAKAAARNNKDIKAEDIENGCDMGQIIKAFTELTKVRGATEFALDLASMTAMAMGEEDEEENPT
jgi:hypothetical protein